MDQVVWTKKSKGSAKIYTHSTLDRAIVENQYGIHFDGVKYPTVDAAKDAALSSSPLGKGERQPVNNGGNSDG